MGRPFLGHGLCGARQKKGAHRRTASQRVSQARSLQVTHVPTFSLPKSVSCRCHATKSIEKSFREGMQRAQGCFHLRVLLFTTNHQKEVPTRKKRPPNSRLRFPLLFNHPAFQPGRCPWSVFSERFGSQRMESRQAVNFLRSQKVSDRPSKALRAIRPFLSPLQATLSIPGSAKFPR